MQRIVVMIAWLAACPLALTVYAQAPAATPKSDPMHPRVKMETSLGDIVLELDVEHAPITTLNFIQYADAKFYDGTVFHRVISKFMIQGGGFTSEMDEKKDGLRPGIKNEWQNGLKNARGTIAMARLSGQPDSATAQFFINVVDNGSLDTPRDGAAYAVFGKVVEGMETVDKIRDTPTAVHPKYAGGQAPDVPVTPVIIKSCRMIGEFDRAKAKANITATELATKELEAKASAEREMKLADVIKKAEEESKSKITKTASGLMYVDFKVGEGATPKSTDRVELHYTGWLVDGTKFDSSVDRGTPTVLVLNQFVKGFAEGVGAMKVGGKRRLIIPPDLAYGKAGRPGIPPDATLVFDVELLSIKK